MLNDPEERPASKRALTATTFVEIVDTLVGEFDVVDVLTGLSSRCVELLDAAAAGILLADRERRLRVVGASTEQTELLELFQLQNDEGPCLDCFTTGTVIVDAALGEGSVWPQFAIESVRSGFASVCAVPLRQHHVIFGCLNVFMSEPVSLSRADVALAQALADIASVAIMQDKALRTQRIRDDQLRHALESRFAVEQARGMIAERAGVDTDVAFSRLRAFAKATDIRLTEVAAAVVAGTITGDAVFGRCRLPSAATVPADSQAMWCDEVFDS